MRRVLTNLITYFGLLFFLIIVWTEATGCVVRWVK